MRILIVDDNQELASALQMMLEDEGFEVRSAKDGHDGYWAYLDFNPDLILTDIQMPGENGLELMEHIRAHNPMVRTIYMSGDLDSFWSPLEEETKRYPVSLLEKPFSKGELMGLLHS
ncbi:MAG: response regulator [Deltaproteobacteria bacterium]|nr:MAG: response regulator [Deltaproteobacteria bacterium]RPJ12079.1 MAG: response regulator [Deltaproteobacteria bacterium]